ncbi:MAG TPA: FHA domain-containing protein [Kofleriaceae bacterium]|nr:FHA domain-containing protein [Kofleriaceae bacterium]
MTVKRDLKRRVRQRQARTGEAYVTARRHVVAAQADPSDADDRRAGDTDPRDTETRDAERHEAGASDAGTDSVAASPDATAAVSDPAPAGVPDTPATAAAEVIAPSQADVAPTARDAGAPARFPVVEVVDVTEEARRLGFLCQVGMFPSLIARVEPTDVLRRLRELLLETAGDPEMELLFQVAMSGVAPRWPLRRPGSIESVRRFVRRALAGMGGVSEGGNSLAFHIAGAGGVVPVLCGLSGQIAKLTLSAIDDMTSEAAVGDGRRISVVPWREILTGPGAALLTGRPGAVTAAPMLFVIHDGRRHPITRDEFLIGRNSRDAHLAIEDGMVAHQHAAVICRGGAHYLKDLGSTHGIYYKGMRIDNKRIHEGDVFQIGDQSLRFTYESDDGL